MAIMGCEITKTKNTMEVLCVGSTSYDIFFPMDGISILNTPEDILAKKQMIFEVGEKYGVRDRFEAPGGCAANVSQGLARLGVDVGVCGVIGDDFIGKVITEELSREGVVLTHMQTIPEHCSDIAFVIVDTRTGERTIFSNRDANEHLAVDIDMLDSAKRLFVSSLSGVWEENMSEIRVFIKKSARELYFNPGGKNIRSNLELVLEFIAQTYVLFVNKDEATEILHSRCAKRESYRLNEELYLLDHLQKLGPAIVALTDGARGVWIAREDMRLFAKTTPITHMIDSTGAGDAFASAFVAALLHEKSIEDATRWGIANGASVIGHYGAKQGLLHQNEMRHRSSSIEVNYL